MAFRIALQLYTIRGETGKDFFGACKQVRDIGYEYVEAAGFGGHSPTAVKREFDNIGLKLIGSHVSIESVLQTPEIVIEHHREMECDIVTIPGVPESMRKTYDDWIRTANEIEKSAQIFADAGLQLAYHNHDVEFRNFDGKTLWEILFAHAPKLAAQIDVFWVHKANYDSVELIQKMKGKVHQIHAKDLAQDGSDTEIGTGTLPWNKILRACKVAGTKDLIVEMDFPKLAPFVSAKLSLENLKKFIAEI
ncbi:MAG TPA: sugar phosphate isomerase/epimerase [Fimbriimonadales bacterium]|nr:sugar phosphate isomerase/epimerase [Fimbriimonadales bacterium]